MFDLLNTYIETNDIVALCSTDGVRTEAYCTKYTSTSFYSIACCVWV